MTRALVPLVAASLLGACADAPDDAANPNDGLLRDFLDGKFDAAGHPLNAKVLEAEAACGGQELRGACDVAVPDGAMSGELTVNARLRVKAAPSRGAIVKITMVHLDGSALGEKTLTVSQLRGRSTWLDLSVDQNTFGNLAVVRVEPQQHAIVELDYLEIFPKKFGLVVAPGSGVYADTDTLTFEVPQGRKLERLDLDGADALPRLAQLLAQGKATRETTSCRT